MRALLGAGLICLTGCSAIDMATTAMLSRVNPLTADPADYAIEIALPPGLGLEDEGAKLALQAEFRGESLSKSYTLQQTGTSDGGVLLAVKPEDLEDMRQAQAQVMAWETTSPSESTGSLSATLIPCLLNGDTPLEGEVSISLRTEVDGPFRPLMHPYSAQKLVAAIEEDAGEPLSECDAASGR